MRLFFQTLRIMPWIIDGHQDLAYNAITLKRDILRSAAQTRAAEEGSANPGRVGGCTVGWPDFQRGQVAVILCSIFQAHRRYMKPDWEVQAYTSYDEARRIHQQQLDYYRRLAEDHPQQFRLVFTRRHLDDVLAAWEQAPASFPGDPHPVGLVLTMEGAEGIRDVSEMEAWWQAGLRSVGLVWSGGRFCGGTYEAGGFTSLGYQMLDVLAGMGFALDLAHMNEISALQALDAYPGTLIASHANARALLKEGTGERHLTDQTIRRLAERGGVIGVIPYNRFLLPDWSNSDDRALVRLEHVLAHIDHICQVTGSARHAAFGTDFDGGFGWPAIPQQMDSIADLQKMEALMAERGYGSAEREAIFSGNWRRILEQVLPDQEAKNV